MVKKWRIYLSLRSIFAHKFILNMGARPISRKYLSLIAILVYTPISNNLTDFKPHKQRAKRADL
jgi:hypothetical protein